ncbi:unnamed protein product [Allacma fusca]|uniref:Uncharacterized protein n=1 Tax=Allacma fusca TaxID=39272 RepID=A0A8J2PJ25_9HEXA|nr:unnamed protein product [Allacma fusca]
MTQVTGVGAKRARVSVPGRLVCSACDSKFFDVCGPRENALRLNQIFLESLAVGCPEDDQTSSSLRFCPGCSHKLSELDTLMSELENLQLKIQNMKDFLCATVTNAAFQAKQGVGGDSGSSNSYLSSIRDQVVQSKLHFGFCGDCVEYGI